MAIRSALTVAFLTAMLAPAGCASTPPQAPTATGASVRTMEFDGQVRSFRLFRPENVTDPVPLVVVLHGWGFTAAQIEQDYGWNELAEDENFVVVHPEGLGMSWNAAGDCCGPAAEADIDDIGFITALVERLKNELPIDAGRVYAAGMSNGGVLAYALACRTSQFSAISSVVGTQVGACDKPRPTSVLQVHGLADTIVHFDGGPGVVPGAQPVPHVVARWRAITDCENPQRTERGPVVTIKADCVDDREVTLVTIAGEGHTWPGRAGSTAPWDATVETWRFFSRSSNDGGSA